MRVQPLASPGLPADRPSWRRPLRRVLWLGGGLALAGAIVLLSGLVDFGHSQNGPAPAPAPVALQLAVEEITTVATRDLTETVRLTGSLQPLNRTTVRAQVAAKLAEVLVREGQRVQKGDILARFETQELDARLAQQLGNLAASKAQLAQAERTRLTNLALRQRDIVSQTQFDQAQSSYETALANHAANQALVDLARKALADAVVRAPIAGQIADRMAQPGETLAMDGKLLAIVDLSAMEIEAAIPPAEAAQIRLGQPAELTIDGLDGRPVAGTVARIAPLAMSGSRALQVFVAIDNTDSRLRGGMFAVGRIIIEQASQVVALPPAAVRRDGEGSYVLKLAGGDKTLSLVRQPVTVRRGWNRDEWIEIDGVAAGDRVVVAPLPGLKPAPLVKIG